MKKLAFAALLTSAASRRPPPRPDAVPDVTVVRAVASVASARDAATSQIAPPEGALPAAVGRRGGDRDVAPDASVPRVADGGRAPRAVRVAAPLPDDTQVLIAAEPNLLHVRVVERPGQRAVDLVATPLDAEGAPAGEARLLRRTTGPEVSLSASVAGDHLGESWITDRDRGSDGDHDIERISAGLHARADLGVVDAPVTFEDTRFRSTQERPCGWTRGSTDVFAREDGGALVVATGGVATCLHAYDLSIEHPLNVCCSVWREFHAEPGGRFTTHAQSEIAPDDAPTGFARVPGVVVYVTANALSGSSGFVTVAIDSQPTVTLPRVGQASIHDDIATAWTGDGVAAIGVLALDVENEE